MAILIDKSMPTVAALYDTIPYSKGGRWRGPRKNLLFDIACGLVHTVPLTKLVELNGGVFPYLMVPMVTTLAWAGKDLVVQE